MQAFEPCLGLVYLYTHLNYELDVGPIILGHIEEDKERRRIFLIAQPWNSYQLRFSPNLRLEEMTTLPTTCSPQFEKLKRFGQ